MHFQSLPDNNGEVFLRSKSAFLELSFSSREQHSLYCK